MLSEIILKHFRRPLHRGRLENYHGEGWAGNQGRYMRIQVRLLDNHIEQATFETQNCVPAIACGSALTDWVIGKPLAQLAEMDATRLEELLRGLPHERKDCAQMALHALRKAVEQALKGGNG